MRRQSQPTVASRRSVVSATTAAAASAEVCRKSIASLLSQASHLFDVLDESSSGKVCKKEFVEGLAKLPYIDITSVEAARMFDSLTESKITGDDNESIATLSSIKETEEKFLELDELAAGVQRWEWLRSMLKVFSAFRNSHFAIPESYDYTKSTVDNYGVDNLEFSGPYADIRQTRDYNWHRNVSLERQDWQDMAIKTCLGKTEAQARPWVVYTCGPMGVGKGHVLNWLSAEKLFPLEYVVHVDPDFFKSIMPEWTHYRDVDEEQAGSFCHAESIYLQEIAMETALRQRQHVLVDGSLSNGEWFSGVFDDIRARFPHYRIAIVYITASEATVRKRIHARSLKTGRMVPESQIVRSLESPEKSISLLAPKTDLVVRIVNEEAIELKSVEDHSGNWYRGLQKHFGSIAYQRPPFPEWLGPLYLEPTSIVGNCMDDNSFRPAYSRLRTSSLSAGLQEGRSGTLFMESKSTMSWKRRHVVLAKGTLSYYKIDKLHPESNTLRGEVPINALTSLVRHRHGLSEERPTFVRQESGELASESCHFALCGIKASGAAYTFELVGDTTQDRDSWCDAIQTEIENAKSKILCAGVLLKQGQFVASWKNRFFILTPGKLSYYTSEEDQTLRGEVLLNEHSTVMGGDSKQTDIRSKGMLSGFLMNNSESLYIIVKGVKKDGSEIVMNCSTTSTQVQSSWINIINTEIHHHQKLVNLDKGFYANSFEDMVLNKDATRNSPNLKQLQKTVPELPLLASKIVRSTVGTEEDDGENVAFLRWMFPGQEIDFSGPETREINIKDPDICLVRLGGLLEYDSHGVVRTVRAIVEHQTMHMVEFGEPEKLMPKDADRLHAGERWLPVRSNTERAAGAKYLTFILPYEKLESRRFPKFGCFAYIFREPHEPADARDRYFPLVGEL